jgi:hypothetical protein
MRLRSHNTAKADKTERQPWGEGRRGILSQNCWGVTMIRRVYESIKASEDEILEIGLHVHDQPRSTNLERITM